jgi:hypothetical protein
MNSSKYIITKFPTTYTSYRWSVKDSINDKVYDTFEDALKDLPKVEGAGVAELWTEDETAE